MGANILTPSPLERAELHAAILAARPAVARFAAHLVGPGEDDEDIAQEACLRALDASARIRDVGRVRPFLFKVARNLVLDRARHVAHPSHPREMLPPDALESRAPAVDEALAQSERATIVRAALARLPELQRTALILHRFHGLGHDEIAEILGTTPGSSRASLHLGLRRLREMLRHRMPEWDR
ncbi:MAG: sigma-70 family RNA polymerase sigma factor [Planctomycetes bacterium]|nr:sigma-70 family RNA polymerase sigma factor [Planctomycetota bacterium]MBI3848086.1 sigma-70 family RNA polymerase sigma factor [Planctomycetota bacterium]